MGPLRCRQVLRGCWQLSPRSPEAAPFAAPRTFCTTAPTRVLQAPWGTVLSPEMPWAWIASPGFASLYPQL